jgi:transposase
VLAEIADAVVGVDTHRDTHTRQTILSLPHHPDGDHQQHIRRAETHRSARAIRQADVELADSARQLTNPVRRHAAMLLERPGTGPVSAAQAMVSFSRPGRRRNDAAFASVAGTSPIPASSGQPSGGDPTVVETAVRIVPSIPSRTAA